MNRYFFYLLALALSVLFIYFVGGFVIIFASLLVIFDRCFFGRVKIFHGVEFSTISILLVAVKYDLIISVLFCILVLYILPSIINLFLGDKGITNKEFKLVRSLFGLIESIISVLIIFYLRNLDLFLIIFIILIFGHIAYILKGKATQTNYVLDYIGISLNFIFNLALIYFFKSFWLWVLA
jgi:hypothetical protein